MSEETGLVVTSIGGMCPTQAEGTMNGNPFYFRARHGDWTLTVVKPECDPVWLDKKDDVLLFQEGDDPTNGWMDESEVRVILQKAFSDLKTKTDAAD